MYVINYGVNKAVFYDEKMRFLVCDMVILWIIHITLSLLKKINPVQ